MLNRLSLIAALAIGTATAALAQDETPREGGKLIFSAGYGSSITSLDITATPHTQDEIFGKAINASLYTWDPVQGEPVLELAE